MKILYVNTPLPGFRECLFHGELEPNGLPSFNKPLKKLIHEGHTIDMILLYSYDVLEEFNIKAEWVKKINIIKVFPYRKELIKRLYDIKSIKSFINDILERENYDFVYGHGSATSIMNKVCKKNKVPFGQRIYGTFMWDQITKKGYINACLRHVFEYKAFHDKKYFLLVTNDGSKGDKVYKRINGSSQNYDFYFWINGVNKPQNVTDKELEIFKENLVTKPFIFTVGRFDEWKRQEHSVTILKSLRDKGFDIHLYLAGPKVKDNEAYFNKVFNQIETLNLNEYVTYMGNIDAETISNMSRLAIASINLNDVCNLTNVFHELLSSGAIIITKDDGATSEFIKNKINGFMINNLDEAVRIIINLLEDKEYQNSIRCEALKTSSKLMCTWDERVEKEISLIREAVNSNEKNF